LKTDPENNKKVEIQKMHPGEIRGAFLYMKVIGKETFSP
jgi:hypothetical protein